MSTKQISTPTITPKPSSTATITSSHQLTATQSPKTRNRKRTHLGITIRWSIAPFPAPLGKTASVDLGRWFSC
jgi:hypothetical protein